MNDSLLCSHLVKISFGQFLMKINKVLTFQNFDIWFVFFVSFVEFLQKCQIDLVCIQPTLFTEFEAYSITSLWASD